MKEYDEKLFWKVHPRVLNLSRKLNPDPWKLGLCGGFAIMAANAIISQELESFHDQLLQIQKIPIKPFEQSYVEKRFGSNTWRTVTTFINDINTAHNVCGNPKEVMKHFPTLNHVGVFSGIYTLYELERLFYSFSQLVHSQGLEEKRCAFVMTIVAKGVGVHVLCFSYDAKQQQWSALDANWLPAKYFVTFSELIAAYNELISVGFDVDPYFVNYCSPLTSLYCHKQDEAAFKDLFSQCLSGKDWQRAHSLSTRKMQMGNPDKLLRIAVLGGDAATVKKLGQKGRNTEGQILSAPTDIEMMTVLLELGEDINLEDPVDGMTSLHIATEDGDVEAVRFLLNHGANPYLRNKSRETPYRLALDNLGEDHEVTKLLKNYMRRQTFFTLPHQKHKNNDEFLEQPIAKRLR